MSKPAVVAQCRFTPIVGWIASRDFYWGGPGSCPDSDGGEHKAHQEMGRGDGGPADAPRNLLDLPLPEDATCVTCARLYLGPFDEEEADEAGVDVFGSIKHLFATDDGEAPLYWRHIDHAPGQCWENCDGRHLIAVCPDGAHWDIDSRAHNCGKPKDRIHRCWVRQGDPEADPPTVNISKAGNTCAAGAGSIQTGTWHGFLRHGTFTLS